VLDFYIKNIIKLL